MTGTRVTWKAIYRKIRPAYYLSGLRPSRGNEEEQSRADRCHGVFLMYRSVLVSFTHIFNCFYWKKNFMLNFFIISDIENPIKIRLDNGIQSLKKKKIFLPKKICFLLNEIICNLCINFINACITYILCYYNYF